MSATSSLASVVMIAKVPNPSRAKDNLFDLLQLCYAQFLGRACFEGDRCAEGKIKSRLIGNPNPDEWDLPPKPRWMRWRT
jgi:hypothetical protein